MTRIPDTRVATCLAAVAVTAASAALLASPARAGDDSLQLSPDTELTVAVPAVDLAPILDDPPVAPDAPVSQIVADTVPEEPAPAQASDGGSATPPQPTAVATGANTPDGTVEPGSDAQASSPAPVSPASVDDPASPAIAGGGAPDAADVPGGGGDASPTEGGVPADTTPPAGDTAGDTGGTAATAPRTTPTAPSSAQDAPSNLNVSVRIGSPGDTGGVTQLNLALLSNRAASGILEPSPADPAAAPAAGVTGDAAVTGTATAIPSSGETSGADTWSWRWDCLSRPDFTAISSEVTGTEAMPSNWNWIWNCGGNDGQYQGMTSSQYRPSNVNVSIRIGSPGNDGPVSQSNVLVSVGAGGTSFGGHVSTTTAGAPSTRPMALPGFPSISPPGPPLPQAPVAAVAAVTTVGEAAVGTGPAEGSTAALLPAWIGGVLGVGLVATPVLGLPPVTSSASGVALPPLADPGGPRTGRFGTAWARLALFVQPAPGPAPAGRAGVGAPRVEGTSARLATTRTGDGGTREPKRPRWRAPAPQPAPESAPSGTSAAPATGGGASGGGGIPIFLALPFLAAMLDLARRVVLEGTALPSGHRSHMPDDPG